MLPIVVALLCVVLALGFGLRLNAALNPTENPNPTGVVNPGGEKPLNP